MKKFFSRYALWVALALCLLVVFASFVTVYASASRGTYEIRHVSGDDAALDGLELELEVGNNTHHEDVRISDGQLSHHFGGSHAPHDYRYTGDEALYNVYGNVYGTADAANVTAGEEGEFLADTLRLQMEVSVYTAGSLIGNTRLSQRIIQTDMLLHAPAGQRFESYNVYDGTHTFFAGYTNSETPCTLNGLPLSAQDAAGNVYVTPCILGDATGQSAIYRLSGPDWEIEKIASFDAEKLYVYDLRLMGEQLYLLCSQDGALFLRTYSQGGALLAETPICTLSGTPNAVYTSVSSDTGGDYACYAAATPEGETTLAAILPGEKPALAASAVVQTELLRENFGFANGRWIVLYSDDTGAQAQDTLNVYDAAGTPVGSFALCTDRFDDSKGGYIPESNSSAFSSSNGMNILPRSVTCRALSGR